MQLKFLTENCLYTVSPDPLFWVGRRETTFFFEWASGKKDVHSKKKVVWLRETNVTDGQYMESYIYSHTLKPVYECINKKIHAPDHQ